MRLFTLLLLMPLCSFAQSIEVTGHFVIAPISSEQCEASAITIPTYGLPSDSELFVMLLPFMGEMEDPTYIEHVTAEEQSVGETAAIYDVSGRQLPALQPGLNIVIDKDGNRKKVLLSKHR